jgi:pimeloyl-ACP methyl ester carboxylesterase
MNHWNGPEDFDQHELKHLAAKLICLSTMSREKRLVTDLIQRALFIALAVYVGLGLFLYFGQSAFIYYPTPDISVDGVSTIRVKNSDVTLKIHVVNPGRSSAVLYFGGNAEAVVRNAPVFSRLFNDHTLYLMNYRGYGGSEGRPTEYALYDDALKLFDQVAPLHEHLSVIGRSLGSGIATYLAAERDFRKLILVTPFDSLERLASSHYPVYPMSLMLRETYNSLGRVPHIREQTLILVAADDRIVMPSHAHELAAAFPAGQATIVVLPDTGHNSISFSDRYYPAIQEFLGID